MAVPVFKHLSSSFPVSLLISFCAAIALSTASFRVELAPPEIMALCEKSINHTFCLNFLNSTAGIPAADLLGAGKITLNASLHEAKDTRNYVKALVGQTTIDPKLKQSYETCLDNYDVAIGAISEAKASLLSGDYETANIEISAAQTDSDTCNDEVKGAAAAAAELAERNDYLFNVLDVALVITNKLAG